MPRNDVTAQLLTPKWLGLSALVLILSAVFAWASSWQYDRAIAQVSAQRAAVAQPLPIAELVPVEGPVPDNSLGRTAMVSGRYVADAWVTGRTSPDGQPGVWLVSVVDDGSGTLTAVLRGWLPDRSAPNAGPVEVTGKVSSPENFYSGAAAARPDELVTITDDSLAATFGPDVRPGYVVLSEQLPALRAGDPVPVPPVFGTRESVGFPWQNAGYALQWASFIGFVGFMYWRYFRDDLRVARQRTLSV